MEIRAMRFLIRVIHQHFFARNRRVVMMDFVRD